MPCFLTDKKGSHRAECQAKVTAVIPSKHGANLVLTGILTFPLPVWIKHTQPSAGRKKKVNIYYRELIASTWENSHGCVYSAQIVSYLTVLFPISPVIPCHCACLQVEGEPSCRCCAPVRTWGTDASAELYWSSLCGAQRGRAIIFFGTPTSRPHKHTHTRWSESPWLACHFSGQMSF